MCNLKEDIYSELTERLGRKHLKKRLLRQINHTAVQFSDKRFKFHLENMEAPFILFKILLKCFRLWQHGLRNAMDYQLRTVNVALDRLPASFDGFRLLLNESVPIRKDNEEIWLAGIDDCHFYEVDNLEKALKPVPRDAFKLLLSHSPELYRDAAALKTDYYLCGHTHGGQICLPGSIPLMVNAACSRKYCRGFWAYKQMQGYTSSGTGSSGLPIRFYCPPEVVIHEFHCK